MSELFLILHKVRGQPAFDVAQKIEVEGEEGWIVPTSGHRAYPFTFMKIDTQAVAYGPDWDALLDHYHASRPEVLYRKAPPKPNLRNLLAEIGLRIAPKMKVRKLNGQT